MEEKGLSVSNYLAGDTNISSYGSGNGSSRKSGDTLGEKRERFYKYETEQDRIKKCFLCI